jgi:hypothetical protein
MSASSVVNFLNCLAITIAVFLLSSSIGWKNSIAIALIAWALLPLHVNVNCK